MTSSKTRTYYECDSAFQAVIGSVLNNMTRLPAPARATSREIVDGLRRGEQVRCKRFRMGLSVAGEEGHVAYEALKALAMQPHPCALVIGDTLVLGVGGARATYTAPDISKSDRRISGRFVPFIVHAFLRVGGASRREAKATMKAAFDTRGALPRQEAIEGGVKDSHYSIMVAVIMAASVWHHPLMAFESGNFEEGRMGLSSGAPGHSFSTTLVYMVMVSLATRFSKEKLDPALYRGLDATTKEHINAYKFDSVENFIR